MSREHPIRYGDVFNVSGDLASTPIAPQDAATMQSAENRVLGETKRGGPASVMQSAAAVNERSGVVGLDDLTIISTDEDFTISEAEVVGHRIIIEAVAGQLYDGNDAITVGEALETAALSAGDKPVDLSDASAIQAAEARATGLGEVIPGGVGATAQSAATLNLRTLNDENKTTLADVLTDATTRLRDKPVTREDAEGVIAAEIRNKPDIATYPGGVSASMAAAARLNQEK